MAVCAASIEVAHGIKESGSRRVPAADMAGIAYARHPHLEQLRVAGTVRFMAVRAVLHHGRVFPQERAAPFCVATQTILVHSGLPKLTGIGSSVRVMATRAGYFAFPIRHVRGALQLRPAHLMTTKAEFRLRFFQALVFRKRCVKSCLGGQRGTIFLMRPMAVYAGHGPRLVRAAPPEQLVLARVALQTRGVLLGRCIPRVFSKTNWNRILTTSRLNVCTSRTVAGFATAGLIGSVRMSHRFPHCCSVEAPALILVTGDTGITADVIAIGLGFGLLIRCCG